MKNFFKQILIITGVALMFSFTSGYTPGPEQHIGVWKGNAGGKVMIFKFEKEGFIDCVLGGEVANGRGYTREGGVKAQARYVIDYGTSPISFDLVVSEVKTGKELDRLKGIIEFKSDKKMRLALAAKSGDPRPTSFKQSVSLKKI